jgi:DNA-binding transcriptional LysR family regulator
VQNTSSIWALVSAGVGVTTLSEKAVSADRDDVVFREISNLNLLRTLGILTPKGRTLSHAAKACAEFILQNTASN